MLDAKDLCNLCLDKHSVSRRSDSARPGNSRVGTALEQLSSEQININAANTTRPRGIDERCIGNLHKLNTQDHEPYYAPGCGERSRPLFTASRASILLIHSSSIGYLLTSY